ncbi:hypothetical protein PsorP6_008235 [Peronosclerospora sorghi]|uniref:Uncharacterized protein n=1 Tax=Peronosclerospora sorghi TaxID=230839 RepID=A0ACC0W9H5_9STRA|nr:hypothetical protein PsorP6_008235 [Peronosclerospora sorghi]
MKHARREEKVKILHNVALADSDGESVYCYTTLHYFIRTFTGIIFLVVLLIASTLWSLFTMEAHIPIVFWHRLIRATALLLLWSCLVGYLEHNEHNYSIIMTLQWGTPRVLQFLLGVSLILVGYALFDTIYFGNKMEEFGTISASMMNLFSLMNGDIIADTFDAMEYIYTRSSRCSRTCSLTFLLPLSRRRFLTVNLLDGDLPTTYQTLAYLEAMHFLHLFIV